MGNVRRVQEYLDSVPRDDVGEAWVEGKDVQDNTGLSPADINDAVEILRGRGHAKVLVSRKGHFKFGVVTITAQGRLWLESQLFQLNNNSSTT